MKELINDNTKIVRISELKGNEVILVSKAGKFIGVISFAADGYYGYIENMHIYQKRTLNDIINDEKCNNCKFFIAE